MTEQEKITLYRQLMQGHMRQDIIVVEDDQRMPFLNEEYLTHYFYMGLCLRGSSKGQYDYHDYCFKAGDICWLLPNHVLRHDEATDDYTVLSVFINTSYYQKLSSKGLLPRHYYPFFVNSISLTPQQFDLMLGGYRMLGRLAAYDHPLRDELICKMCDVMALMGDEFIRQRHPYVGKTQKHFIQLFENFYSAVIQHHRESREVSFYARLESLTPKYFATAIKQTTGQSASQWINNYVIVQAKWMLQHEHHKTVQQIAHQLGFSEQASFSRFFKLHNGMSPTEYREQA